MFRSIEIQLRNRDCVEGMADLAARSVDLCVTSPPYNLGIQYGRYDDCQDRQAYLQWTRTWATALHRILAEDGSLFLNVGAAPSNPMLPHEVLFELKHLFVLQNTIHWVKSITVETRGGDMLSVGHFKPIHSDRFLTDSHEFIFHLTKHGNRALDRLAVGVPYVDKSNIARWSHSKGRDRRCRGNTWFIPYPTITRRAQKPHPATFPRELPSMCIRLHGWKPNLVMIDPFLGNGNSALAAIDNQVAHFIGFEIDPEYLSQAKENVSKALRENVTAVDRSGAGRENHIPIAHPQFLFDAKAVKVPTVRSVWKKHRPDGTITK